MSITLTFKDGEQTETLTASSLHFAADLIKGFASGATMKAPRSVTVTLSPDIYTLAQTLDFSSEDIKGLEYTAITFVGEDGAEITGAVFLEDKWTAVEGKPYLAYQFEKDAFGKFPMFRDLYLDGVRVPLAKSDFCKQGFPIPYPRDMTRQENFVGLYLPKSAIEGFPKDSLFPLEVHLWIEWEFFILHVLSIDDHNMRLDDNGEEHVLATIKQDELEYYIKSLNKCLSPKNRQMFFQNHVSLLTPGSYTYNHHTGELLYYPDGETKGRFSYGYLEHMFMFKFMSNITFENISFTGTTSTLVLDNGYISGQANFEHRSGGKLKHSVIYAEKVRHFTLKDCTFHDLGANALMMLNHLVDVNITGCTFKRISMAALSIGTPNINCFNAEYQNFGITIHNNYFYQIGYEYPTAVAIFVGKVDGLSITHNTIKKTAYSAISIGWSWAAESYAYGEGLNIRHADISYNSVEDYMQLLRDGAAIYVVGANCISTYTDHFNFMHNNYAERVLADSSKRGYYLDGSSSNWHLYDNVTSGTSLPIFSQFHVPTQFTYNNLIERTYSVEHVSDGNHAPERNTILKERFEAPTLAELLKQYPDALAIKEKAGCDFEDKVEAL